jgi:hypothetical protein
LVHAVSEEKIFSKSTNQKQEWPVAAMFVNVLIHEQTWPPQAILVFDWWFKKNLLL